jgi:hypothetical protein
LTIYHHTLSIKYQGRKDIPQSLKAITMTRPRKQLVAVEATPYYHVVSRCVRRSYLCSIDAYSGKDYEHRRQWIENRIRILSSLFTLDICGYAAKLIVV